MSSDRPEKATPGHSLARALRGASLAGGGSPDLHAMRRWLLSAAVVDGAGAVISWCNPRHPGYAYPEAAGLLLSLLCTGGETDAAADAVADRVAGWLSDAVVRDGAAGRDATTYMFDSAVALAGLLRHRAARNGRGADAAIHRLHGFVCDGITAGLGVVPASAAADGRWSTQFGAHLLKCLHALHLYGQAFAEPLRPEIVSALIDRCGRQPSPVYVHPFCYEQEGHVVIAHYGLSDLFEPVDGALELLASLQQEDGSILAFANGMEGFGEPRTDATAQAVRLWLLRDRDRYADAIARALAFLARCQTGDGGILYAPGRDDVCSWSTMFTCQAVEWLTHPPRLDSLL